MANFNSGSLTGMRTSKRGTEKTHTREILTGDSIRRNWDFCKQINKDTTKESVNYSKCNCLFYVNDSVLWYPCQVGCLFVKFMTFCSAKPEIAVFNASLKHEF